MSGGVLTLTALGVLPTLVIYIWIYRNAPVKKVPFKKLLKVFGLSMVSVIPAAILEAIGMGILGSIFDVRSVMYWLILCIFVIALSEEGCKYFSFKLMIFNDREFSNTYDGLFYGAAAALGFATLENIMYIFNNNGLSTALLRMVMSVPGHASTGIFMGYYFGISKYKKYNNIHDDINPQRRAYIISVLLHGFYDFFLMVMQISSNVAIVLEFLACIAVLIIEYIIMIRTVRRGKRESFNIYNRFYYEKMNGAVQDMVGHTNEHLVQMPAYNYNTVPNNMGAPMLPNMPMNSGYPQPNVPPVNGGYPQPNIPPMNNGYPQPNVPPVNGGYPQPNVPTMNNVYPQPNMPQQAVQPSNTPIFGVSNAQEEMQRQQAFMAQIHKPVNRQIDVIFDDPAPKNCPKCGSPVTEGNKFCIICGTKLVQ